MYHISKWYMLYVRAAFYENIAPNGKNGHINSRKNAVEGAGGGWFGVEGSPNRC